MRAHTLIVTVTVIMVMFALLGGKHYEEYGICHSINQSINQSTFISDRSP